MLLTEVLKNPQVLKGRLWIRRKAWEHEPYASHAWGIHENDKTQLLWMPHSENGEDSIMGLYLENLMATDWEAVEKGEIIGYSKMSLGAFKLEDRVVCDECGERITEHFDLHCCWLCGKNMHQSCMKQHNQDHTQNGEW